MTNCCHFSIPEIFILSNINCCRTTPFFFQRISEAIRNYYKFLWRFLMRFCCDLIFSTFWLLSNKLFDPLILHFTNSDVHVSFLTKHISAVSMTGTSMLLYNGATLLRTWFYPLNRKLSNPNLSSRTASYFRHISVNFPLAFQTEMLTSITNNFESCHVLLHSNEAIFLLRFLFDTMKVLSLGKMK